MNTMCEIQVQLIDFDFEPPSNSFGSNGLAFSPICLLTSTSGFVNTTNERYNQSQKQLTAVIYLNIAQVMMLLLN